MKPVLHIACLHTVDSNIAVFEAAAKGLDLGLSHVVRADLLARAEAAGGLTDAIRDEAADLLREMARDADAVLLTSPAAGLGAARLDAAAGKG